MIDKKEFIHILNTVIRELTCMSDSNYEGRCEHGHMAFTRFDWVNKVPLKTIISITKLELEEDANQS